MLFHRRFDLRPSLWVHGLLEAPKPSRGAWLACVMVASDAPALSAEHTRHRVPERGGLREHGIENGGECMGGGRRRLCGPPCAAHAALKRSESAGARAEPWGRQAQGAPGPRVDTPTAWRQAFATPPLGIGTEAEPGGTRRVRRPCMPMEAHLGEDDVEREGLYPRDWCEVDAREPVAMCAESTGGLVALGVPMGGRGWGERLRVGLDQGSEGTEDALHCLIAGHPVRRGKGRACQRGGECAAMGGAVIPLQGFGKGGLTGCHARVTVRGEGVRSAFPSHNRAEHAPARSPGHITKDVGQVERHGIQRLLPGLQMVDRPLAQMVSLPEEPAELAEGFRWPQRRCHHPRRRQL